MKAKFGLVGLMVLAVLSLSCSKKSTSSGGGITYSSTPNISMTASSFSPQNDSVAVGTTITWTMATSIAHTVTSDQGGLFDTTLTSNGQTYSRTFNSAGDFNYHCEFHGSPGSGMFGRIKVR
jgi:plastocyanin